MSVHIAAKEGEIAEAILLPGDPLRAKFVAENFLKDAVQYTGVRNILGYTGTYKGKKISVQGTGMGIPSISIYVNELFREYGVKRAIRIGTAGSLQKDVQLRDMVLAMSTCTDSGANNIRFGGRNYAPYRDIFPFKDRLGHCRVQRMAAKSRPRNFIRHVLLRGQRRMETMGQIRLPCSGDGMCRAVHPCSQIRPRSPLYFNNLRQPRHRREYQRRRAANNLHPHDGNRAGNGN